MSEPYLREDEAAEDQVDRPLQRLDEQSFVEELEEDQRKLQEDAQQPETRQLWDLSDTEITCWGAFKTTTVPSIATHNNADSSNQKKDFF